jgi:DNA-binding MarR family transcriptional regulator
VSDVQPFLDDGAQLLACLQHAGLVTRRSVCGDKRGIGVALTEKARNLLEEAAGDLAGTGKEALGRFMGPARRRAVSALMPDFAAQGTPE